MSLVKVSDDYIPPSMLKNFYLEFYSSNGTAFNFNSDVSDSIMFSDDNSSYLIAVDGFIGYLKEGKQDFQRTQDSISFEVPSTGFYFFMIQNICYFSRLYKPASYDIAKLPGEFTTLEGGYINSFDQVARLLFSGKINADEWEMEGE